MTTEPSIQMGFPDELRQAAAELYDAAFGAKLSRAIPDTASRIALLTRGTLPVFSFVALRDGQLAGIAGFKTAQGSLTGGITFRVLQETLGFLGAIRAGLILSVLERSPAPGQLLMDGIAVAPEMRGAGIGTRLLQRMIEYASREGYQSLRLDVIDTNAAARRLYERMGFAPARHERFAGSKSLLGFEGSTTMVYHLTTHRQP